MSELIREPKLPCSYPLYHTAPLRELSYRKLLLRTACGGLVVCPRAGASRGSGDIKQKIMACIRNGAVLMVPESCL